MNKIKKILSILLVSTILFSSCDVLQTILLNSSAASTATPTQPKSSVITDIIDAVMGNIMLSEENMYGKWDYRGSAVAFESKNLLKKAGGEVVASQAEAKLDESVKSLGINAGNTYFVFNNDKTYEASIGGIKFSGNYILDVENKKVRMTYLMGIASFDTTIVLSGDRMKLMMEADAMLRLMKMLSSFTNNTAVKVLGEMSEMYDGMLLGFDLTR